MDGIALSDRNRAFEMECANTEFVRALTLAGQGVNPRTSHNLIWRHKSCYAESIQRRYIGIRNDPEPQQRNPCARCGVRQDKHANHGCGTYVRGGFG